MSANPDPSSEKSEISGQPEGPQLPEKDGIGNGRESCPVCGGRLFHEKCKVVCRSEQCTYRIIYTCAEF